MTQILKYIVGETKFKADPVWVENTIAHLLWKLAAYGKALFENEQKFLSPANILHHTLLCYKKEFEEGRRSFF